MNNLAIKKLFLLLLTFLPLISWGQRYPVQATLTLTPPYGVRLSQYAQPTANNLQANIWLKDLNQPDLEVKFKLRIENLQSRLVLETKQSYMPEPYHLVGGQQEMLNNADLSPYFDLNNLQATSGSLSSIVSNGGKLPDGYYKFSLVVLEYYTGRVISNTALFQCPLLLSDPPLLLMPYENQKVAITEPQFVSFSWNPRHLASPNRPQNVTYRFQVVEILREGQTAGDAFATTPPIIDEENLMAPAYQVGPADTPLVPGQKYAWRVQAYDVDELGLIKNEGWSEMRIFQFGDACLECGQLAVETITPSRVELSWYGDYSHQEWEVRYRRKTKAGEEAQEWRTKTFLMERGNVKPLSPDVTYEFQVRGQCGALQGKWSQTVEATTGSVPEKTYVCEGGEIVVTFSNSEPLTVPMEPGKSLQQVTLKSLLWRMTTEEVTILVQG
ncbi:fibronectin type III domain-containing protein [Limibacter armeniacum]|uniref:fibronectin type III domain-containing protein n=1 Tax=Limibacter armeniacum TaxID=466084 RepID=UPI002FE651DC